MIYQMTVSIIKKLKYVICKTWKKKSKTKENKNKTKNHRKHSSRREIFISIIVTQLRNVKTTNNISLCTNFRFNNLFISAAFLTLKSAFHFNLTDIWRSSGSCLQKWKIGLDLVNFKLEPPKNSFCKMSSLAEKESWSKFDPSFVISK